MLATKALALYTSVKVRAQCSYLTHRGLVALHCHTRNDLSGKMWNCHVDIKHLPEWLRSLLCHIGALVPYYHAHSHACTIALALLHLVSSHGLVRVHLQLLVARGSPIPTICLSWMHRILYLVGAC